MTKLHHNKQIAFLFGAGVSIPAGLPTTQNITSKILSGEGIIHDTDGNYYFGKPGFSHMGFPDAYVPKIIAFLSILKRQIEQYYSTLPHKVTTNYEDIYFMASQIYDTLSGEYDNPAIFPLIEKIKPELQPMLIGKTYESRAIWTVSQIADEATKYIRDVVWRMLRPSKINPLDYLDILSDAYNDSSLLEIYICTLNNDRVIETYFSSKNIIYNDGFYQHSENLKVWSPESFENSNSKIRFLKLHGSVDWFRLRAEDAVDWSGELVGIPKRFKFNRFVESGEQQYDALDHRPIILVGTYNKMLDYTGGIIEDTFHLFYELLRNINTIIVCGYSFGDRGINTKIIDWIYSNPAHRLIVIHHNPNNLKENSLGSIKLKWDDWIRKGKLSVISKRIEETSWSELKNLL